jgi:hypothetical protein
VLKPGSKIRTVDNFQLTDFSATSEACSSYANSILISEFTMRVPIRDDAECQADDRFSEMDQRGKTHAGLPEIHPGT